MVSSTGEDIQILAMVQTAKVLDYNYSNLVWFCSLHGG